MTTLHITENSGNGSEILCGAERKQTYRQIADGSAHRYIERFFLNVAHVKDPEVCHDCLREHVSRPEAKRPALFDMKF